MARKTSFRQRRGGPTAPPPVIFRWDLDKTYLKSDFDSLRELVRIPFERPEDKIAAPGVTALIRALRDSAMAAKRDMRTYFISASPPQIGRAIKKKLELDGVLYDGIVFKDQLHRLMRGKFRHLREQVGFKLTELLKARRADPSSAREYLFGDDWESDSLIYSLFADVVAGRVDSEQLSRVLRAIRVETPLMREACRLAEEIEPRDSVARIFITLERRTPLAKFRCFGPRLVPTFNYFQTAVCLHEEGVLDRAGIVAVAQSLCTGSAYTPERLANSLADLQRRQQVRDTSVRAVHSLLREAGIFPTERTPVLRVWEAWFSAVQALWQRWQGDGASETETPPSIDYLALVGRRDG